MFSKKIFKFKIQTNFMCLIDKPIYFNETCVPHFTVFKINLMVRQIYYMAL